MLVYHYEFQGKSVKLWFYLSLKHSNLKTISLRRVLDDGPISKSTQPIKKLNCGSSKLTQTPGEKPWTN